MGILTCSSSMCFVYNPGNTAGMTTVAMFVTAEHTKKEKPRTHKEKLSTGESL